jgi:hypothetical protein
MTQVNRVRQYLAAALLGFAPFRIPAAYSGGGHF